MSFLQRVLEAVLSLGECTPAQVEAVVARHIPANKAVQRGQKQAENDYLYRRCRKPTSVINDQQRMLLRGRREIVNTALGDICHRGLIRRVARGVYAPPLPKLHTPAETA